MTRVSIFLAALFSLVMAAPVSAGDGDVNADTFYTTAVELSGKGMGAMFDKRTKPMMLQLEAAAVAVKAENEAARAKGKPIYCVPDAQRKKGIDAKFVIDRLGRIPKAKRANMTLTKAWREVLVREYPCA